MVGFLGVLFLRGVGIICISACFLWVWVGLLAGIVGFWVLSGEGLFFLVLVRVVSVFWVLNLVGLWISDWFLVGCCVCGLV